MTNKEWNELAEVAWSIRENAYILGDTRVGSAVLSPKGGIFGGCNIEHRYRCHDVHAEVNAISNMVAAGFKDLLAVFVAAERDRFTPCGSCMDWIFQFGGPDCWVAYQSKRDGEIIPFKAHQLMPYYPE
jgi:cytidine deaminase